MELTVHVALQVGNDTLGLRIDRTSERATIGLHTFDDRTGDLDAAIVELDRNTGSAVSLATGGREGTRLCAGANTSVASGVEAEHSFRTFNVAGILFDLSEQHDAVIELFSNCWLIILFEG